MAQAFRKGVDMLQHNEQLYLPTNKLYTIPNPDAYKLARTEHLNAALPDYANKTLIEKWEFLITGMEEKLLPNEVPVLVGSVEECKRRFETFKTARQNTSASYYSLSLDQCVSYFEDFYFLYTTENPQYHLRPREKVELIRSILDAMGHCETGINGQFYAALQNYQKDTNWIMAQSTKARCAVVRRIADEYNTQNRVGNALSIHTFDMVVTQANKIKLGIPKKETILDVFAWLSNSRAIAAFFKKKQSGYFQEYERQLETTLTTHLFSEMVLVLPSINGCDIFLMSSERPIKVSDKKHLYLYKNGDGSIYYKTEIEGDPIQLDSELINSLLQRENFNQPENESEPVKCTKMDIIVAVQNVTSTRGHTHVDKTLWESQAVSISPGDSLALGQFFNNYFPGPLSQSCMSDFFVDDDNDITISKLKPRAECLKLIQDLIQRKLIEDNYYIDLQTVTQPGNQAEILKLHKGISVEMLKLYQDVLNQQVRNEIPSRKGELLVNTYPEIFYKALRSNLSILQSVKSWIKSTVLTDEILKILDADLGNAIERGDEEKVTSLLDNLISLIHPNYEYISQLSPELLGNALVITKLLRKDGAFLGYLPTALWTEQVLQLAEISCPRIRTIIARARFSTESTSVKRFKAAAKFEAINELKTTPQVDVSTFMLLVRDITPSDLSSIIAYRKAGNLAALPFCGANNIEAKLVQFQSSIAKLRVDWGQEGYLAVKKQACKTHEESGVEDDPIAYLARSNDWFSGFAQFQQQSARPSYILTKLKQFSIALLKALFFSLALYLLFQFTWFASPILFGFVDAYFLPLGLTIFCLWLLNFRMRNRVIATINTILWHLLFLDANFFLAATRIGILVLKNIYANLIEFFKIVPFVAEIFIQRANAPTYFSNNQHVASWEEKCDVVIRRLQLQDEPAAEEKAILLQEIKSRIANEENPHDELFLNKKYEIRFKNHDYNVSFADVAKQRRDKTETFTLEPVSKRWFGLFTVNTSSEDLLPKVESRGVATNVIFSPSSRGACDEREQDILQVARFPSG